MQTALMDRPIPAVVVEAERNDSEIRDLVLALFAQAERAVDSRNWNLGRFAAEWKARDASRTDADFAEFCGGPVSVDKVQKARKVWAVFGGDDSAALRNADGVTWSHCYAALSYERPAEAIEWAIENPRTIKDDNGNDKQVAAAIRELTAWIQFHTGGRVTVGDNDEGEQLAPSEEEETPESSEDGVEVEQNEGRDPAEAKPYAPFRSDATKPRDHDVDRTRLAPGQEKSAKQKRATMLLDRMRRDFRSMMKMGLGDMARDHADSLAEQQRQGEKLDKVVGLCKQTQAALIRDIE